MIEESSYSSSDVEVTITPPVKQNVEPIEAPGGSSSFQSADQQRASDND